MKIVGRRRPPTGGLKSLDGMLQMMVSLREGRPFVPRGVYRFRSHEEADAWLLKMLTR